MLILTPVDMTDIEKIAIIDGKLQVLPYSFWRDFDLNTKLFFMHKNGYYIIPTTELIDFLRSHIIEPAIEIGAGNGFLGRALNVPITDSKLQNEPAIRFIYYKSGTPIIHYPDDVQKLDAVEAMKQYKPTTVFGSYITCKYNDSVNMGNVFGVDDQYIVEHCKKYIMIGNKSVEAHYKNPLMQLPHEEHYHEWIITRAAHQEDGRVFIWNNDKQNQLP